MDNDWKNIIKEFEAESPYITIGAMAYRIQDLRKEVAAWKKLAEQTENIKHGINSPETEAIRIEQALFKHKTVSGVEK